MNPNISRRQAILTGFASLGAPALSAQAPKPVNIGVIGIGMRSRQHLDAFRKLSDARVAALCDIESARMTKANQNLPEKAAVYTDYRELLRDKNVGVVVIVTPPYLHHEMTLAAIRAGKDVMVEKPLATTYAHAREIEREAARAGRIVAVSMQRRYFRGDAEFQQVVDSGAIGPIRLVTYSEFRGDWNPATAPYTDPATGRTMPWRHSKKATGSSELEFSIHALAMVVNMVKSKVVRVAATGAASHYPNRDTRDTVAIIADFANGARLNYSFSNFAAGGGSQCVVIGDKGVLRRDQNTLMIYAGGKKGFPAPLDQSKLPTEDAEVLMYRDFFRNVRDRTPSLLSPSAAIEPSKIAYAADISIAENRIVTDKDFA